MPVHYSVLERDVIAFLEREADLGRRAQDFCNSPTEKLYCMGQRDALLLAADAIRNGVHRAASGMSAGTAETRSGSGLQPASPAPQGDAQPLSGDSQ